MNVAYYVVVPFDRNDEGDLAAGDAQEATDALSAERGARELALEHAVAVAFSRTGNPSTGEFHDAVILAQLGNVDLNALSERRTAPPPRAQNSHVCRSGLRKSKLRVYIPYQPLEMGLERITCSPWPIASNIYRGRGAVKVAGQLASEPETIGLFREVAEKNAQPGLSNVSHLILY
jgi:hypothetical protein